jgi:3-hydroxyisobutyrate dehydrogenase-like beta-hydroxyacid dehydrogenase
MIRAGFIGLGNIGAPMARRLAGPEWDLTVFDVDPAALDGFAGQARRAETPAGVGAHAEIVGVCVRDEAQLMAATAGPDGLLAGLRPGGLILVHSTVRPIAIRSLAEAAAKAGVSVMDVAVTGGPHGAATGALCAMAGGETDDFIRATPFLESFASRIIHAGALGNGMVLKACNNLVTYLELMAADESVRLARANGLDIALLREVMTENGNLTDTMRRFLDFRDSGPGQMGRDAFRTFQSHVSTLAEKDLDVALGVGEDAGIALPASQAVRALIRGMLEHE